MIPSTFKVEIETAAKVWQDVTASIESLQDGLISEAEIVPRITITFGLDLDDLGSLLDPETNRGRARIRVTEGSLTTYYLMEAQTGDVAMNEKRPTVTGRAFAGLVSNWRKLTHEWNLALACSTIAAQAATQDTANMAGAAVGVEWQATLDPVIPAGYFSVTKKTRLEILKEIAEACAAGVRVSTDGLRFEIYDTPSRTLTDSAARTYTNGLSLSYRMARQNNPANAVRVQGEVPEFGSLATLPTVGITVVPATMAADGTSQVTARAIVKNGAGRPVQLSALVDEPISAGSYTEIPVSGCFSVQGVWLNTGSQASPVKGAKIAPSSFTANAITVPTQTTQLFIVSYTQAESVSWGSADVQREILGEAQNTTGTMAVSTTNNIGTVRGVFRATDTNRTGTNYYTGGSATPNQKDITLGLSPGASGTAVIIDYEEYEATPAVTISPSSSLCDADGWAETTVGAGSSLGLIKITGTALGQTGSGLLSLTGTAIGSLDVVAEPATIRAKRTGKPVAEQFTGETDQVKSTTENGWSEYYIEADNKVSAVTSITIGAGPATVWRIENGESTAKIFLVGEWTVGAWADFDYYGFEVVDEADQESTITATVKDDNGDPATDGTEVAFRLLGKTGGASLSAAQATTIDGEVSVTLTAGDVATFTVRVIAGPFIADITIAVVDEPLDSETEGSAAGTTYLGASPNNDPWSWEEDDDSDLEDGEYLNGDGQICKQVPQDNGTDGSIYGCRQFVDCDGAPLKNKLVEFADETHYTDDEGWACFTKGSEGENTVTVDGVEGTISIAPAGAESRGNATYEVCRDA